jgi:ferredoxin
MTTFLDTTDDLHPYECGGKGHCVHCDRKHTEAHDPDDCALCDDGWGDAATEEAA